MKRVQVDIIKSLMALIKFIRIQIKKFIVFLKFGRKKPIRESLIPSNIIDILKSEEILYTVVSVFQSGTHLKPHRDHTYIISIQKSTNTFRDTR